MPLIPILVATHVALALALLLPSLLLPFALRIGARPAESDRSIVRGLLALQASATTPLALGVAASGAALVVAIGTSLLSQPWLLVALAIYGANLGLAFFVQRPDLVRLVGLRGTRDDRAWRARARRQRYVSYAMAGLTGTIGLLMSAKPELW
ncbi:MAG TPA: hypothetical protein VFS32_14190 [Candidatus Limnocylindrales bacterium]|nr:hypothetical protein [Candidatus Limnocylindrales bacterium]